MEPSDLPELARATQAILKAKNLTVNSASARLKIDRGVLTRMAEYGSRPRLDVLERFARGLRLDVNEWRVLAGYEPVEASEPPGQGALLLDALLYRLSERAGQVIAYNGLIDRDSITVAQAERFARDKEAELREEGLLRD